LEQCFVFSKGKLRANANGRQRFGEHFRRAGFDIDAIRTFDELEAALHGSWHIVMSDLERDFERRHVGKFSIAIRSFALGFAATMRRSRDCRTYAGA
jgi:hypothetical protein